ncbi:MAG: TldD/PmbA family protein [Firmicutes bacterium]|nr:TldD/PmbA family protein [Bacillota bacterium]
MFAEEEIQKILNTAVRHGGDFADLYLSKSHTGSISAEEKRIRHFYRGFDEGAGIRVMKGDFAAYFYTNDLSLESLLALAERAGESVGGNDLSLPFSIKEKTMVGVDHEAYDLEAIGKMIRHVNDYAWTLSDQLAQVSISYGDVAKDVLMANTEGKLIRQQSSRKRFFVRVIAKDGNDLQSAIETLGDTEDLFLWDETTLAAKVEAAAHRAMRQLSAKEAPSGTMPVIMSSEAGGTMVHEACGHGLEGDSVSKGLSVYKDKKGQKVASDNVTVIDDATLPHYYGSHIYDDEGNKGQRNVLIENGVLKDYMYDIRSARRVGTSSTGNGRRENYCYAPQVRMTNTFIAPGNDDPKAIIADVKKGFFVKKMGGGQVNTISGDFVFEVSEGWLIENGELTVPVKNASLIGNGPKTLSSVYAVGNDLGFAIGTCGKGGQSAPVSDAQPTLGISELVVGGKA